MAAADGAGESGEGIILIEAVLVTVTMRSERGEQMAAAMSAYRAVFKEPATSPGAP